VQGTAKIEPHVRSLIEDGATAGLTQCPMRPKLSTVRKGRVGAQRDANKRHFVEGWLAELGLNVDINKDIVTPTSLLQNRAPRIIKPPHPKSSVQGEHR
jgi:hypothetical protein